MRWIANLVGVNLLVIFSLFFFYLFFSCLFFTDEKIIENATAKLRLDVYRLQLQIAKL